MIPKNEKVYIDANFLVAYLIPNHVHHIKAGTTMVGLLVARNILYFSPLCLSETLHGIIKEKRKDSAFENNPTSSFYSDVKNATDVLLAFPQLELRQFENNLKQSCVNAVEYMRDLNMKSHDAFHVAHAKDLEINYVVTNDSSFDGISALGIQKIDFVS